MNEKNNNCPVILQTGFRIFFLGASIYATLSMAFWYLFYVAGGNIFVSMPFTVWHGHEMVFGFTMAVIAGFLLTAVTNWTGLPTLSGLPLMLLFILWCMSRIFAFMPSSFPLWPQAISNSTFIIFLLIAVIRPIVAVKQWKQSSVISKIVLMLICAMIFHFALAQEDLVIERQSLRFAVYMIISLILTIARRVIPFFIERGVGYDVTLRNSRVLDMLSLVSLVLFSLLDIIWPNPIIIIILSAILCIVHSVRLIGWYTSGIWKKPLLWILFVGYVFIITGFLLKLIAVVAQSPDDAALHAWTVGGIGAFTLGMMARVSWGHTGRNIAHPPKLVTLMFSLIVVSAIVRVFPPLVYHDLYVVWVAISQGFWMLAFATFIYVFAPILISARPDGKVG